ncbi:MAG TPA: hypothetical protein VKQ30_11615 [Ktedonobacterales bacterium]|nr:hypothetical protein [Ktedonobacterales bacterium]
MTGYAACWTCDTPIQVETLPRQNLEFYFERHGWSGYTDIPGESWTVVRFGTYVGQQVLLCRRCYDVLLNLKDASLPLSWGGNHKANLRALGRRRQHWRRTIDDHNRSVEQPPVDEPELPGHLVKRYEDVRTERVPLETISADKLFGMRPNEAMDLVAGDIEFINKYLGLDLDPFEVREDEWKCGVSSALFPWYVSREPATILAFLLGLVNGYALLERLQRAARRG